MPSKLDYLSKYMEDGHDNSSSKKKKKKKKKKKDNSDYEEPNPLKESVKAYDEDEAVQFPKGDQEEEVDNDILAMPEEERPTIVSSEDLGEHADVLLPKVRPSRGTWNTTASGGASNNDETNDGSTEPSSTRRRRYDSSDDDSVDQRRHPRKRYDSDDDDEKPATARSTSPPKQRLRDSEEDERRQPGRRYDSDDELDGAEDRQNESMHRPRRRYDSEDDDEHRRNADASDPVKREEDSRRPRRRYDSDDEPEEKGQTKSSPPPQRGRRYDSEDDEDSFGRRKRRRYDSDEDKVKKEDQESKIPETTRSSGRRRCDSEDEDEIKSNDDDGRRQRRKRYDSSDDDDDGRDRMSSGHKAGLQNYKDFNSAEKDIQQRKQNDAQVMVDKYGMGETVYRDAQGRRTTQSEENAGQFKEQEEQMKSLNEGQVQRAERELKAQEMAILQNSAFARHETDHRLEDMRKNEIRKGDPMAAYALKQESKKKKKKKSSKKSSDASMEEIDEKPVYKGPPPRPNRFGIRPGYRWDGVDRGNGWEDKLLAKQYMSKAKEEESYRWRSADM